MKKISHILRPNHKTELKDNWVFFDTETYVDSETEDHEIHKLKLGVAQYYRLSRGNEPISECVFHTPKEFIDFLEGILRSNICLNVVALNLPFDFIISGIGLELKQRGWKIRKLFYDSSVTVIKFRKDKSSILFLDFFNYIKSSVKEIGKVVGLEKLDIDFSNCTLEELETYCRRDVEIIARMGIEFVRFVKGHDLGSLGLTISSTAFNAFRHRFMKHKIFIHAHDPTMKLEREGYFGGRVEAFFIGELKRKTYYLDVNSMYPFVMKYNYYPTRLWKYQERGMTISELYDKLEDYCVIAECLIKTPEPVYPVRQNDKVIFPVGTFKTVLNTASLKYAVQHGYIKEIYRYAIYDKEYIFNDYVDYFYDLKRKYTIEKNSVYKNMTKLFLNSLYGKFAQRNIVVSYVGEVKDSEIGIMPIYDEDGSKLCDEINFLGNVYHREIRNEDSFNSFTAIASHVTDYARMYLYNLIKKAGIKNTYYVDTDSLFVNKKGMVNLQPLLNDEELGSLKLENIADYVEIRGPKDYTFGNITKTKGISKTAIKISNNQYKQNQFPSLSGIIRERDLSGIKIKHVTKTLNRKYEKGIVTKSGWVRPYRLHSK